MGITVELTAEGEWLPVRVHFCCRLRSPPECCGYHVTSLASRRWRRLGVPLKRFLDGRRAESVRLDGVGTGERRCSPGIVERPLLHRETPR